MPAKLARLPVRRRIGEAALFHANSVNLVRFSPDGRWIATRAGALESVRRDGAFSVKEATVTLWERSSFRRHMIFEAHNLAFAPDSRSLFLLVCHTALGKKVQQIDVDSGSLMRQTSTDGAACLAISPDGRLLAVGAHTKIVVYAVSNGEIVQEFEAHPAGMVASLAFVDNCRLLSSGLTIHDTEMYVWDARTGKRLTVYANWQDTRPL